MRDGVCVAADERDFAVRLARYCARKSGRNSVSLGRMQYHKEDSTVTYHSDKPTGPTSPSSPPSSVRELPITLS